jgi:hypothetical protein
MGTLMTVGLIAALAVWLAGVGRRRRNRPIPNDEIDRAELEAAEREVRDLEASRRPEDGFDGDDWGPGATGSR